MNDRELLNELKNKDIIIHSASGKTVKLSKISSFSVGDEKRAPTDEEILGQGINRKCIFLGLNPSETVDKDWANFHRERSVTAARSFDYRIFHLLERYPSLKRIYMTDLGKGKIDGNGGSFIKSFKLAENEDYRNRCFEYFKYELNLLNGKNTIIICMYWELPDLLSQYGEINERNGYKNIIRVAHYANTWRGYGNNDKFYNYANESWKRAAEKVAGLDKHKS